MLFVFKTFLIEKYLFSGEVETPNASEKCFAITENNGSKSCVFPFLFNGKLTEECLLDKDEGFWCSTKVNKHQEHISGHWGLCSNGCLKNLYTTTVSTSEATFSEKSVAWQSKLFHCTIENL